MIQTMHSPYHILDLPLSSGLACLFHISTESFSHCLQSFIRLSRNTAFLLLQMCLPTLLKMPPFLSLTSALSPSFLYAGCRLLLMQR